VLLMPFHFINITTYLRSNSSLLVVDILSTIKYSLSIYVNLGDFKLRFFNTTFTFSLSVGYPRLLYL
jgi:hypothetical protein